MRLRTRNTAIERAYTKHLLAEVRRGLRAAQEKVDDAQNMLDAAHPAVPHPATEKEITP